MFISVVRPILTGLDMYGGDLGATMKTGPVQGTEITIKGIVFDGTGTALRDAMIEIWQPDAAGAVCVRQRNPGHG